MLRRCSLATALVLLACSVLRAEPLPQQTPFPYQAFVTGKGASARSGPGLEFYATDFLAAETVVEVYQHRGTWAAIRPPENSFSWVPASDIEITGDPRVGKSKHADVPCRIGTRYGTSHSVEFVRLAADEMVSILGRDELSEPDGTTAIWYQIAPPAGEFRWIRRDDLTTQPATRTSSPSELGAQARDPAEDAADDVEIAPGEQWTIVDGPSRGTAVRIDPRHTQVDPQDHSAGLTQPGESTADASTSIDSAVSHVAFDDGGDGDNNNTDVGLPDPSASNGQPLGDYPTLPLPLARPATPLRLELLWEELLAIELGLTQMVVQAPTAWDLSPLRIRTQSVIDMSPSPELRADANRILAKIAQFEDLQRRHVQLQAAEAASPTGADRASIANLLSSTMTAAGLSAAAGTRGDYAGMGWLMPLVTRRSGVPRYALTDQDGNIVQFVTPAPGLNLNPYMRKRIGVYGQRGFIPDLNKPHLMAERIVTLDRVR